jgi:predicted TIM-barrel fold metal-dependent hydrolase
MEDKTAERLHKVVRSNGVDKALISSLRSVFYHAEEGNEEVLAACKKFGETFSGLATLTPLSDRKGPGYRGLKSGAFKGIRIYPQHHSFSLSNAQNVYELAEKLDVPVVICYRLIMSWSLPSPSIEEVLALPPRYPKVKFVLSGFNYDIIGVLLARRFPPNLYVETSGAALDHGVEMLVEILGTDHVMLGTGLPVQYPQSGIQKVLHAKLDKKQMTAVTHGNAAKLFAIK